MKGDRCSLTVLTIVFLIAGLSPLPATGGAEEGKTKGAQEIADWQARWELARTLSFARKLDESIEQYEKLLKAKPDLEQAKAEMATVMFWKGKQDEALKILDGLPRDAMTPEARLALADLQAARGDYDKAVSLYQEHLKTSPKDDDVRFRLAEVLSWARKYKESVQEYETVLAGRPGDKQVRRKYAFVLSWMGEHDKAATELKKTLDAGLEK